MSERKNVRTAIAALVRAGKSTREINTDLECSKTFVLRVKRRLASGKSPQVSPRKRKKTTLTPRAMGGLKKQIKAAPTKSLRRVAKEANVPRELVWQVVRDTWWRSLRKVKVPLISAEGRTMRVERSRSLINIPQGFGAWTNYVLFRQKNVRCGSDTLPLE